MTTSHDSFELLSESAAEAEAEMAEAQLALEAEEAQYQAEAASKRAEMDRAQRLSQLAQAQNMLGALRPAEWARTVQMMNNWEAAQRQQGVCK